jgi:hypothetical protein
MGSNAYNIRVAFLLLFVRWHSERGGGAQIVRTVSLPWTPRQAPTIFGSISPAPSWAGNYFQMILPVLNTSLLISTEFQSRPSCGLGALSLAPA